MSSQVCNLKSAASAPDRMLQNALPVLKQSKRIRGCKLDDSYKDGEPDPHNPGDFRHFSTTARRRSFCDASAIPASPVIVDTCRTP